MSAIHVSFVDRRGAAILSSYQRDNAGPAPQRAAGEPPVRNGIDVRGV
jgi:hypothetical protein